MSLSFGGHSFPKLYHRFLTFILKVKFLLSFSFMVNPPLNSMPLLTCEEAEMVNLDGLDPGGGNEMEVHLEVGSSNVEDLNPYNAEALVHLTVCSAFSTSIKRSMARAICLKYGLRLTYIGGCA